MIKKMHKKVSELKVITASKKMFAYIMVITEKSPKKFRYSFVLKLHQLGLDLIEALYLANDAKLGDSNRLLYQNKVKITLKLIDTISLMAYESSCILFKQYEQISMHIHECDRLLKTWILSDDKRMGVKQ